MIRLTVALLAFTAFICSAFAQSGAEPLGNSSRPAVGGASVRAPTAAPTIGASNGSDILRHRGPTGRDCLAVGGLARPHVANREVYDHVITVTNNCPQRIALQICYYRSQDCISVEVPGGERKETILGTLPAVKDFRYEFREKF
jgi:hypothetical protein